MCRCVARDEIDGLDPDWPLLPQFDLLGDERIRELARSYDLTG